MCRVCRYFACLYVHCSQFHFPPCFPLCHRVFIFASSCCMLDEPFNTGSVSPNANNPSVSVSPYQRSLCSHMLDCCATFPMLTPSTLSYCFPLLVVLKIIVYDFLFEAIYIRAFPLTAI